MQLLDKEKVHPQETRIFPVKLVATAPVSGSSLWAVVSDNKQHEVQRIVEILEMTTADPTIKAHIHKVLDERQRWIQYDMGKGHYVDKYTDHICFLVGDDIYVTLYCNCGQWRVGGQIRERYTSVMRSINVFLWSHLRHNGVLHCETH